MPTLTLTTVASVQDTYLPENKHVDSYVRIPMTLLWKI